MGSCCCSCSKSQEVNTSVNDTKTNTGSPEEDENMLTKTIDSLELLTITPYDAKPNKRKPKGINIRNNEFNNNFGIYGNAGDIVSTKGRRISTHVDDDQINHIIQMLKEANKYDAGTDNQTSHIKCNSELTFGIKSRKEIKSNTDVLPLPIRSYSLSNTYSNKRRNSISVSENDDNNDLNYNNNNDSITALTDIYLPKKSKSYNKNKNKYFKNKNKKLSKLNISDIEHIRSKSDDSVTLSSKRTSLSKSYRRRSLSNRSISNKNNIGLAASTTPISIVPDINLDNYKNRSTLDTDVKVTYHNRASFEGTNENMKYVQDMDLDSRSSVSSDNESRPLNIDKLIDPRLLEATSSSNSNNNNNNKGDEILKEYERKIKSRSSYIKLALDHLDKPQHDQV